MTPPVTPITQIAPLKQAAQLKHASQRTHAPRPPRPCCSRSAAASLAAVAVGLSLAAAPPAAAGNANQTQTLSPVVPVGAPFRLRVEEVAWSGDPLPALHSAASARLGDRLLFTGGKTTGLHDFTCDPNANFPAADFHRSITVIDLASGAVFQRSIDDAASGLSPSQRAALASTNQLSLQDGGTLLAVGGYGIADESDYTTFRSLRLFDVAGTIAWAMGDATLLSDHLRFLDPPANAPEALAETFFALTGGVMVKVGEEYWMCLGQNFQGGYTDGTACRPKWVQVYSHQIRRFAIDLAAKDPQPLFTGASEQPEWARRRDLNVFPARVPGGDGAVALSGVFTPGDPGIWTVPIVVGPDGEMSMPDPADPATLRQGLNIYDAARLPMWSAERGENWLVVLGGLGYQVVSGGAFIEDATVPYSNELFAVRYAPGAGPGGAAWSQHLLGASYPTILSPASGVPFYFGTETDAFPLVDTDAHGMLDLDALLASKSPVRLAVLYGGIVSEGQALMSETYYGTSASNRLFEVWFEPGPGCPADLSGSGAVDGQDLGQLLLAWGPVPAGAIVRADLDGDGFVGAKDLAQLLAEWGPCPKR